MYKVGIVIHNSVLPIADIPSERGTDKLSHATVVPAVPSHLSSKAASKAGSKSSSKAASITNGSFVSIPQEDEGKA